MLPLCTWPVDDFQDSVKLREPEMLICRVLVSSSSRLGSKSSFSIDHAHSCCPTLFPYTCLLRGSKPMPSEGLHRFWPLQEGTKTAGLMGQECKAESPRMRNILYTDIIFIQIRRHFSTCLKIWEGLLFSLSLEAHFCLGYVCSFACRVSRWDHRVTPSRRPHSLIDRTAWKWTSSPLDPHIYVKVSFLPIA